MNDLPKYSVDNRQRGQCDPGDCSVPDVDKSGYRTEYPVKDGAIHESFKDNLPTYLLTFSVSVVFLTSDQSVYFNSYIIIFYL